MSQNRKHEFHSHSKSYIAVWISLMILTLITVVSSDINFGTWNIVIAMLIASIKASLVALFFMHLKDDNKLNQVAFVTSFIFLAVFVGLTASDLLTRGTPLAQAKVVAVEAPAGNQVQLMKELSQATPELLAHGKKVFSTQCVACHGTIGLGDGAAAASMNPKPRNFTALEGWKKGRAPSQIYNSITKGIENPGGSSMPAFASFPPKDRWSLAHYVSSLSPSPVADTSQTLETIGIKEGEDLSNSTAQANVEIPISFAIQRLIEEGRKK